MHKYINHALHCEALSVYTMMRLLLTDPCFTSSHLTFVLKYVQTLQCNKK